MNATTVCCSESGSLSFGKFRFSSADCTMMRLEHVHQPAFVGVSCLCMLYRPFGQSCLHSQQHVDPFNTGMLLQALSLRILPNV